ncbi:MAG: hypothetical protein N3G77_07920 [Nitrososphaeria archaeon]|nr:hypothetical protein [Nitrososphaeria archaeon]MDW7987062.1 hypothetical protein [Nitrososphaerota archaeon]MDW8086349.1 hypothetical protein [Ignisphaera sp.]
MSLEYIRDALKSKFGVNPKFSDLVKFRKVDTECSKCNSNKEVWCMYEDAGGIDYYDEYYHICLECGHIDYSSEYWQGPYYSIWVPTPVCPFCGQEW